MALRFARWASSRAARIGAAVVVCLALGAALAPRGVASAGVIKVRTGGDLSLTRVVVELDRSASGKLLQDGSDGGKAVVLTLPQVDVAGDLTGTGEGLVKSWTVDQAAGSARLKLTLRRDAKVERRFLLPPGDGVTLYRYVLDVRAKDAAKPARAEPERAPVIAPVVRAEPAKAVLKPVIVIDAGHGGKDPGAQGATAKESAVTLAAAKALKARLEKGGKYKVVVTRDSDVYVPLQKRVQIARTAQADLFISLHADAASDPTLRGASVYTLSEKGSERVARQALDKDGFMEVRLPGQDRSVNQILLDLTQRSTRNRSANFAALLMEKIADRTTLLRRSHRDAGFVVLLAPDVPAVLLEMGFMTNVDDDRTLTDAAKRKRLMDGVADAVDTWFGNDRAVLAAR